MAGRGRMPHPAAGRVPLPGPGPLRSGAGQYGAGIRPLGLALDMHATQEALVEQKLATQHAEIQRLLTENQRLAATHVALRQELATVQQELHRLQQVLGVAQAEKEQQWRGLIEKNSKLEADLRSTESLKAELQKFQTEAQNLALHRQELSAQAQQLSQDLLRARTDAQQIPIMQSDIESLQQEIHRARTAFEFEKKANADLLDQRQVLEKNLVSLAREVEKLRAELTNTEKISRGAYGGAYGADPGFGSVPSNVYGDSYPQMGAAAAENGFPYGHGSAAAAWGAYDMQRAGAPHPRR
eukprot:c28238_g1_i6 orf=237-1130(+)